MPDKARNLNFRKEVRMWWVIGAVVIVVIAAFLVIRSAADDVDGDY